MMRLLSLLAVVTAVTACVDDLQPKQVTVMWSLDSTIEIDEHCIAVDVEVRRDRRTSLLWRLPCDATSKVLTLIEGEAASILVTYSHVAMPPACHMDSCGRVYTLAEGRGEFDGDDDQVTIAVGR